MTRISENDRAFRLVATARAVLASPENVTCLPWVEIAKAALLEHAKEQTHVAANSQG
jgi:hypothetical protein